MIFLTFSLLTIVSTVAILVPLCVCVSFWVEEGGLELLPATLLVTRKFHLDVNWLLWISVQSPIVSLQPSWHLKLEEGL